MTFRVWVDPDLNGICSSKLKLRTKGNARTGYEIKGDEFFAINVNGVEVTRVYVDTSSYNETVATFGPGELKAGWNEIKLTTQAYGTCYWQIDYYRFWTELSEGFAEPEYVPGFILLVQ
jgi:hypothetical protein